MTNKKHIIMSTNEQNETIIGSQENNEFKEEETTEGETKEEESTEKTEEKETDEKPVETLEQRQARLLRQLKQVNKKLGIDEEKPSRTSKKSEGFDYGEKAYLTSNGIKGSDEHEFAQKLQKQTGLDLDSLLEDTYFQTKLNEFREQKATTNATPSGTKRSNNSSVDTVEYWIAKGELPPKDQVEMRRKVVNARLKKEDSKGVFYNS
jgi:hypothetical protein